MSNAPAGKKRFPVLRVLIGSLLLIVIVLAACEFAGWPFLRKPAEHFLSQKLERTIRFDAPFRLHLLGGIRFKVGGLYISAPQDFDAPHFVTAQDAELRLRYKDLLQLKPGDAYRIQSIRVEAVDARLLRKPDGSSTWQFKQDKDEPSRPFPIIENLVVRNGSATVKDAVAEADLQLKFDTREGSSNDASKETISHVGTQGRLRGHDLRSELTTYGFLPIATLNTEPGVIKSKGWVEYGGLRADFDGSIADALGEQNIKGKLTVKGPSLSLFGNLVSTVLPTTTAFSLSVDLEKDGPLWLADVTSAHIGSSDLTGKFKYDLRPTTPLLEGDIKGKRFILADLGPAFGTREETGKRYAPPSGRAIPDRPLNLPALNKMDAKIGINLDYVELGAAFQRPIAPFKAQLELTKGKLGLANIDAKTADGSLSGLISVDAHKLNGIDAVTKKVPEADLPVWKIDLSWKDIDLDKWLEVSHQRKEAAKQQGKPEPEPYVTGTLNGRSRLTGKGQSTAELLGSLNGDVSVFVRDGSLSHLIVEVLGLDIAQSLGVLMKGDTVLPMQCALMDLSANKGIIKPRVGVVDTPVTLILVDGQIDMGQEQLGLRLLAKPKNFSPLTVRSPIHVNGTFLKPEVNVEKTPIAARVLGSVALAFVNPLAAILPFMDPGGSQEQSPCAKVLAEESKIAQAQKASQR